MTTKTKIEVASPLTDYKPIDEAGTEVLNFRTLQAFAYFHYNKMELQP